MQVLEFGLHGNALLKLTLCVSTVCAYETGILSSANEEESSYKPALVKDKISKDTEYLFI